MRKKKTIIFILLILLTVFVYKSFNNNGYEVAYGMTFINDPEEGNNEGGTETGSDTNTETGGSSTTNSATFELTCPEIAMESSEFVCNADLKNIQGKVLGVNLEYTYDSEKLSYVAFDNTGSHTLGEGDSTTSSGLTMTFSEGVAAETRIGSIKFRVTSSAEVSKKYNISVKAKVVFEGDTDNYHDLETATKPVMVNKLTNIFNYVKVSDAALKLEDDKYSYDVTVENNITSAKIESSLGDLNVNLDYDTENGNRVVKDLTVGDNINYLILKSNGIEVLKLTININRKDSNGSIISDNNEITENPQTGFFSPIIVFIILLFAIGTISVMRKKMNEGGVS